MRKIIFRGMDLEGCWKYGSVVGIEFPQFIYSVNTGKEIVVEKGTVGQYVGINDKNGCHIYEGDIIRAVLPETVACREYVWPLMAVAFHEGAFGVWQNARDFTPLRSFASRVEFEVVGNVHDNPDMIGGA